LNDVLFWRALALHRVGKTAEAEQLYRDIIAAAPEHFDALHLLGVLEAQRRNFPSAEDLFRRASRVRPDDALALANLGNVLRERGRLPEALASLDRAIGLDPTHLEAMFERGNVLRDLGRAIEALDCYAIVLRSNPDHLGGLNNRGALLSAMGQPRDALVCLERVLALRPDHAGAHWNASLEYLRLGDFETGLRHYEWRWKTPVLQRDWRDYGLPLWTGKEAVQGKRILVWAEQGLGDTILFCRFARVLADRGAIVLLSVQPALVSLLTGLDGVHRLLTHGEAVPEADFQISMLSLPLACGTTSATIPVPCSLPIDPHLLGKWAARLGPTDRKRVGIVWSGNPALPYNLRRSVPLQQILAFADGPFEYICLHKDLTEHERALLATRPDIRIFSDELAGFDDTAALVHHLDLVIAVDTAVAHVAGAVGCPVWMLLPFVTDWRWFMDRGDSPWYPTARLFRQQQAGDWQPVLAEVKSALRTMDGVRAADRLIAHAVGLQRGGRLGAAAELYRAILLSVPDHFNALHLLGVALAQLGNRPAAIISIEKALTIRPNDAVANTNMALVLRDSQRPAEALVYFDRTLRLDPSDVVALNTRGTVLMDLQRPIEALASFEAVLAIAPDHPDALNNKGAVLLKLKRPNDALETYDRALGQHPSHLSMLVNRGLALWDLGRPKDALASYDRALRIDPDYFDALCNRARMLRELHRLDAAIATIDRILHLQPHSAEFRFSSATYRLLNGDFELGWREYESRWEFAQLKGTRPDFGRPYWLGKEVLAGKSILLMWEQGFGDTIQFCRFVKPLAERGAKVVLRVQPQFKSLLAGLDGVDISIADGDPIPDTDFQTPLMSLPLAMGAIPSQSGYIRCGSDRVAKWAEILGPRRRPRIGLAWFGNPSYLRDGERSIPLAALSALTAHSCEFVSLHRDTRPEAHHPAIATFHDALHDFHDTAALIHHLDLVISVDTAIAHLAAALGRPTWIALPFVPDWRWLLDRPDSPWYPTVRLFRQPARGDWSGAIQAIRLALDRMLRSTPYPC